MSGFLWLLVPLAPLAGALLLLRWRDRVAPWLWLVCVPALLAALWPPASIALPWLLPGAQWGADDAVARAFLGFSALLWGCAGIYAVASQRQHSHRQRFLAFWLLSLCGNLLLIIAQDGASFYAGFTLMSLAAYGLVVHLGGPKPRQAGRLYLQLAVLGEMLLYAGLMMRVHEAGGAMGFVDWQTTPIGGTTALLLVLGFGLKAGFWPLHVWLPLAHPAAPAAASAVLSGAMIKAGILGLWRFMPEADPLLQEWALLVFGIGMISAFYGVILGLVQVRAKAALAYSSISQIGYLLAILALAWQQPEARGLWAALLALYAVHHGLAKGALFMGAGLASGYRLGNGHWLLMAIPALALAGLPFTSGAAAKHLLKDSLASTALSQWLPLLTLGSMATALLILRALYLMWCTQAKAAPNQPSPALVLPWATLCLMPLILPWLWPDLRTALSETLSVYVSWSLLWPPVLAAVAAAIVLRPGIRLPPLFNRLSNPAGYLSLRVKRLIQQPLLPDTAIHISPKTWRQRERRWNRFWQQGSVTVSAWLLCLLLLLGWIW